MKKHLDKDEIIFIFMIIGLLLFIKCIIGWLSDVVVNHSQTMSDMLFRAVG